MQRRADGGHLELVAFGGGPSGADVRVAAIGGFKALRQMPLRGDGWVRREFGLSLDSKGGHEHLPIHITTLAYGAAERDDFAPDLASADGVLLLESGDVGSMRVSRRSRTRRLRSVWAVLHISSSARRATR